MKAETMQQLEDWLEEQKDLGGLFLPLDVSREDLLNHAQIRQRLSTAPAAVKLAQAAEAKLGASAAQPKDEAPAAPKPVIKAKPTAVAPSAAMASPAGKWATLEEMNAAICECEKCPLSKSRNKFVFGTGNPQADLVIVGEAPGADEDRLGEPFVGRGGELLTKMIAAIGFSRDDVYICNILKCRPPNNRDPNTQEVQACSPYLRSQLELLRPKLILAVGRIAGKTLLGKELSLKEMRGQVHEVFGAPLRVSYHPAALLRNPHWKRPAWEDLQALFAHYRQLGGKPGSLEAKV
jgi:uracil-DNA glycosylase family 4